MNLLVATSCWFVLFAAHKKNDYFTFYRACESSPGHLSNRCGEPSEGRPVLGEGNKVGMGPPGGRRQHLGGGRALAERACLAAIPSSNLAMWPPSPDDGGDGNGAATLPVDLIVCDEVEPSNAQVATETGPVERVQVQCGCGGDGPGLRPVKEGGDLLYRA